MTRDFVGVFLVCLLIFESRPTVLTPQSFSGLTPVGAQGTPDEIKRKPATRKASVLCAVLSLQPTKGDFEVVIKVLKTLGLQLRGFSKQP